MWMLLTFPGNVHFSSSSMAGKANLLGKRERGDDLWTKTILKKHKEKSEEKETTEGYADQANLISVKAVAVRKKTLSVANLSPQTKISDIINFFKDVGQVFLVRLMLNNKCKHAGCGFVEFAPANEAKKALQKKNGEILLGHEINLDMAKIESSHPPQQMYCIDHKVWHEDYLQRESLLIGEHDESADFAEAVLFVANLSPQTKIWHIDDFFYDAGEVVSVRLIVNHEGKHVGYGFVEFASAKEAKKALEEKNGEYLHDHKIFLQVVKIAPYPPQHKYNLAEMLCYEDYIRQERLLIGEDELVEGCVRPPNSVEVRKKTLFFPHISRHAEISDIISFFKDAGEVVSVRFIVYHTGKRVGCGFVEFASANEAKKALEKKKGGMLHGQKFPLQVPKIAPYPPPKYCIEHKVWYEDYLRRESRVLEEDETVKGLPDFAEEVAARKKTLFVANLSPQTQICHLYKIFGEVVSTRLIVNDKGKHVGCGYVEFASANDAKKMLEKKKGDRTFHGRKLFLQVAEVAPYPPRPRYNLAELLWYQEYLGQESLVIEEDDDLETEEKGPKVGVSRKITFSYDD